MHFNVTDHPTAAWTAQQLVEACAMDEKPKYLIRDRDAIYGKTLSRRAQASASKPFCRTRFNSFNDGPFGFFLPCSHFCTVDGLVFRYAANTA